MTATTQATTTAADAAARGVPTFLVAATTARTPGGLRQRLLGDGLVPCPARWANTATRRWR
jgi:hypothetical protein